VLAQIGFNLHGVVQELWKAGGEKSSS